jgi:hypothetical protein
MRIAFRSFDRQWIIPDARLIHAPSPDLWRAYSDSQVYFTEQHAHQISAGPGLVFTSLIPDMHHFDARGGRVYPLYRNCMGSDENVAPRLLAFLSEQLELPVTALDLLAYVAAVVAHPTYTARFGRELSTSGIRIPLTSSRGLWSSAIEIGAEVIWTHTYGERFIQEPNRPRVLPLLPETERPYVTHTISDEPAEMPEAIHYDRESRAILLGTGIISPVSNAIWDYEVSGRRIIEKWFSYRSGRPVGRRGSPLDDIMPRSWAPLYTTELLELINVLGRCIALHRQQRDLLNDVWRSPTIGVPELVISGIFPVPAAARKPTRSSSQSTLF